MNYSAKNIFDLTNPKLYRCTIPFYNGKHAYLYIGAKHISDQKAQAFYFGFAGVIYFDGPMFWQGADFRVAVPDECSKLLRSLSLDTHYNPKIISLFIVELSGLEVKILASSANKLDRPPAEYFPNI